jgi:membrane-associated phospholipid phosphatase
VVAEQDGSGRPGRTLALASAAVIGSYLAVRSGAGERFDALARRGVARGSPRADRVVSIATDLGSVYGLAGVSAALAGSGRPRLGAQVGVAGLVAWTAAQCAKPLLYRQRPYEMGTAARLVSPPAGSSWPSGHAAVAAAMTATVLPQLPRGGRIGAVVVTAAVGVSRLRVGVHHLTDVIAGFGVGVVSAVATRSLLGRWLDARSRGRPEEV